MKPRDPETREQWQDAVNLAQGALLVHAAGAYGLITGGPKIDADRCCDLLTRGAAMGIKPGPGADLSLLNAWQAMATEMVPTK